MVLKEQEIHRSASLWTDGLTYSGFSGSGAAAPGMYLICTLKVVSESRVTWATSVPILVFLGLSVLDL